MVSELPEYSEDIRQSVEKITGRRPCTCSGRSSIICQRFYIAAGMAICTPTVQPMTRFMF